MVRAVPLVQAKTDVDEVRPGHPFIPALIRSYGNRWGNGVRGSVGTAQAKWSNQEPSLTELLIQNSDSSVARCSKTVNSWEPVPVSRPTSGNLEQALSRATKSPVQY